MRNGAELQSQSSLGLWQLIGWLSLIFNQMFLTQLDVYGADDLSAGAKIYSLRCASCHGLYGEGTLTGHSEPLRGDRSLVGLTEYISESMPPGAVEKCTAEEAGLVATFLFQEFYSEQAQSRLARSPLKMTHLTSRQYRNAIADLMTSFRGGPGASDNQRGLEGSYATILPNGDGQHAMTRLDPEIEFDFGKSSPDPEKIAAREFAISWRGSILAPDTGDYEFIVRSENSVNLWVNDRVRPLIEAWVKSGDAREFRGVVRLLGGRRYPVQLHFTKRGQGVMKSDEQKAKEEIAPANLSLFWIPPGGSEQIVPRDYFAPHHCAESYVVETTFPPDDRSTGYERGSSISKEWDQATTNAALEVADYVLHRLQDLTGGAQPGPDYETRLARVLWAVCRTCLSESPG